MGSSGRVPTGFRGRALVRMSETKFLKLKVLEEEGKQEGVGRGKWVLQKLAQSLAVVRPASGLAYSTCSFSWSSILERHCAPDSE